ncbi:MAG: hypothetical protein UU40_C0006G0030 [Candidatus Uhrbacteria bacterium GW2011_GWD2_41_121]|uniref:DUF192 domain-containing protein n=1 Tax=Candidatus Uhrbacteria bacterium GW2011_GWC1_41_20 TaxID=1618983 RepID=A0A0G0VEI2_9BACT|nr:MAG: hypothetical protein UT52_C0009G0030 [Candidatus Uhrbacteria bacterium GW2011_GWE1_39_46]KKR63987.1 MAG: hypothetical protein UU04_C0008G0030 [Candidatus Uhrbacteria bacterium GW2011_GWC2_40_450]KKR90246.1 MAG: hypothetical protein UU40_C0006G0030 [Candidatus Uhrbacteria bacterium GW2011_GWD2_41_121]KKR95627.1 MAG: hypothetical protein UU46_C0018G0016 [Candidatus Uhrbacteria bacterium GW2011_GWD1_41_16]KKR99274.1 MAG: hypothetical protein UU50_C0008G0030 [Candidatus Uhrbacteria bacteriu
MIIILVFIVVAIIGTIISFGLSPFSKGEWDVPLRSSAERRVGGVAEKTQISINNQTLEVYIANTELDRMQGLSDVVFEEFDADGMLFEFEDQAERYFWMKDMMFALDIVWIVNDQIVKIETAIDPLNDQGNITNMDSQPYAVDKVLELPAGGVDKYQVEVGQRIFK